MIRAAFIIGPSRSGTSVLAQAMGRHPQVVATEELHFYNLLSPANTGADGEEDRSTLLAQLKAVQHEARFFEVKNGTATDLPAVTPDELPDAAAPLLPAFFEALARAAGAQAVVEQTPMNLYYRDRIRADFPGMVFFLMRRDPRAILASQKMRWQVGGLGARHIPARDIARSRHAGHPLLQLILLRKTTRAVAEAAAESDVELVVYEDLVRDPRGTLARLAARLGLEYDPAMTAVSDAGSSHAREAGGRGFDASRLEGWRKSLTPTEIWLTEKLYSDDLTLPATGMAPRVSEALKLALSFPVALALALYYSAGSYGNLVDAVRRRLL
jgi:hypothetical protein